MTGSYIDQQLWETVIGPGHFNYDSPLYRYWRSLRSATPPIYLGVPVTPEIETAVGTQIGFASGAVLNYTPETGAELANDPV